MYDRLKDRLHEELKKIERKQDISAGDLEAAHKLSDTIKNLDKICMLEEDGYSNDGAWAAEGIYGRGSSYANRGRHLVRSHYSRDGGPDGYSDRRDSRGRYSREDGRSMMMEHLEMALDSANERDRERIRRAIKELENV